ncbi:restriction endonuclease subunit S [Chromobacterium amazonense]|uniref:restriction endonuclease subunit S n=1 Tax=Chromobacterium amazonense TaxID=1382803 RepID=UPI003F7B2F5A
MELRQGYKQSDVGVIPEDWKDVKLGEIAEIRMCKRIFAVQTNLTGDIPFFKIGTFGRAPDAFISCELYREYKRKYCFPKKGDILLSAAGTLGKTVIYNGEDAYFQDSNIVWLDIEHSKIKNEYLYQCYQTIKWASPEGSTISRLYNGIIRNTKIPLPPTETEQQAIATALSDVDALIAGLEKLIAKKRDLKQAAMQQLLTGQTRLPGFSGEWEMKRLGDVADIRSGGTPSTGDSAAWDGDIPWCTPTDITALAGKKYLHETSRRITDHGLKNSSAELIPPDSIVMTSRATIGECAINAIPVTTNQGFKNFIPFDDVDVEFLYYLLQTQRQGFISLCGGSTFLEIGKTQLREYEVLLPSEKVEQTAIAAVLSDMDIELAALEARLAKTRALKQGMMQELLTGRTRLV